MRTTRRSPAGASNVGALLALLLGGGLVMVVVSLFLTGIAQQKILPLIRARADNALAKVTEKVKPKSEEAEVVVETEASTPEDSLQALISQIETQRQILEERREELVQMRGSIDTLFAGQREAQSKEVLRQAKLFAAMRPEEAARVLSAMDDVSLASVLRAMNARAASKVIGRLDPRRMARLSMEDLGTEPVAALSHVGGDYLPAVMNGPPESGGDSPDPGH